MIFDVKLSISMCLFFSLSTLVACDHVQIERVAGEPASTHALTQERKDSKAPAVDGLRRFIAAMKQGQIEAAYGQLSRGTRAALKTRAAPANKRGLDLLRAKSGEDPAPHQALHIADPIALFAMRNAISMQAGKAPLEEHKPADGRTLQQQVRLQDTAGAGKTVVMRFEGLHWRIHNPSLQP
jgi:hypothetical protein